MLSKNLGALTRIFLASDGTLTRLLEAAFSEAITPHVHFQRVRKAENDLKDLDLERGQLLMERAVVLKGASTDRHFVYAKSSIVLSRLPSSFKEALENKRTTIGELWHSHRIHITKQTVSTERRYCPELIGLFSHAPDLVTRRYQ